MNQFVNILRCIIFSKEFTLPFSIHQNQYKTMQVKCLIKGLSFSLDMTQCSDLCLKGFNSSLKLLYFPFIYHLKFIFIHTIQINIWQTLDA